MQEVEIRFAEQADVPTILDFIRQLADYENLSHQVEADEQTLSKSLFGSRQVAEALIAEIAGKAVGFALFFHNFSTFIGKPGLYLEDVYVQPKTRGAGVGKAIFKRLGEIAIERDCGRLEWSVLDWNQPAINFYQSLGAESMDGWTGNRLSGTQIAEMVRLL